MVGTVQHAINPVDRTVTGVILHQVAFPVKRGTMDKIARINAQVLVNHVFLTRIVQHASLGIMARTANPDVALDVQIQRVTNKWAHVPRVLKVKLDINAHPIAQKDAWTKYANKTMENVQTNARTDIMVTHVSLSALNIVSTVYLRKIVVHAKLDILVRSVNLVVALDVLIILVRNNTAYAHRA